MPSIFLNKKAQGMTIDLIVGMCLALIVIIAAITILDNRISAVYEQQKILAEEKESENALNQLITSPGSTVAGETSWEEATGIEQVKFIGLALSDRIIFPEKINKFKEYANNNNYENYAETKGKLLMANDFYFRLAEPGSGDFGTTLKGCPTTADNCEAGKTETTLRTEGKKIDKIIKKRRVVAFIGGSAIAELTVFETR